MPMAFEKTTIIGTSPESFTAAADDAIERASDRFEEVLWAEASLRGVELASVDEPEYQVETTIAYRIE